MIAFIDEHKDRTSCGLVWGIEMLLSLSSGCWGVLEESVEVAGEVALEAAAGFSAGLAFGDAALEVGLGTGVVLATDDDDLVEGPVELTVAAAAEPVSVLVLTRGGFDRCDSAEPGEGGFAAASTWMRPRDVDLCGQDGADSGFVEELGAGGVDQRSHGLLEVTGFLGERLDALRERLEGGLVPNASRSP